MCVCVCVCVCVRVLYLCVCVHVFRYVFNCVCVMQRASWSVCRRTVRAWGGSVRLWSQRESIWLINSRKRRSACRERAAPCARRRNSYWRNSSSWRQSWTGLFYDRIYSSFIYSYFKGEVCHVHHATKRTKYNCLLPSNGLLIQIPTLMFKDTNYYIAATFTFRRKLKG